MKRVPDREIGRRIRELREKKLYTRDILSEKINISAKFLYEIEAGKKSFSVEILSKLAHELSASCDYIVFGKRTDLDKNYELIVMLESFDKIQTDQVKRLVETMKNMYDIL